MWTTQNRGRYDRDAQGYPSDPTDAEWAPVEAPIPPAKPGGGKRRVDMREAVNGSIYVLSTGCQWRAIRQGSAAPLDGAWLFRFIDLGRYA